MELLKVVIAILIMGKASSVDDSRFSGFLYETFGDSRQAAMNQMTDNQNIAKWSAQSAVTSSIGQVYGHQQAALAHTVNQFLIPMKKYQQNHQSHTSPMNSDKYNDVENPVTASTSILNLSGKHIEKFTVEESQPQPAKRANSRLPKEVDGDNKDGNQHRRDTNPVQKQNPKKISETKTKKENLAKEE